MTVNTPARPEPVAVLRTECAPPGTAVRVCGVCGYQARPGVDPRGGHDRVVGLPPGGRLWFGSERPDNRPWLQVGPLGPFDTPGEKLVSSVSGRLWVSTESGAPRIMVENLSATTTIEIRSPKLPQSVPLYPVDPPGQEGRRWLGTAIAALQAEDTVLALVNQSDVLTITVDLRTPQAGPSHPPLLTRDPRVVRPEARAAGRAQDLVHQQQLLHGAVRRITLGSPDHADLLEEFLCRPDVEQRLRVSTTLAEFLESTNHADWRAFRAAMLQRVREDQATHELHRLILEGLGEAPRPQSRYYTDLVRRQLDPGREARSRVGGGGGFADLIPQVRALWRLRPRDLREYLLVDEVPDRGP